MKYTTAARSPLYESSAKLLASHGHEFTTSDTLAIDRLKCEIVFVHTSPFSGAGFTNLKWVVSNTTDTSHIEVGDDIEVVSLQGLDLTDVHSAAEHAIYLAMSMIKRSRSRDGEPNGDMNGIRYALLGGGRIAAQISHVMQAFKGVQVLISSMEANLMFVAIPGNLDHINGVTDGILDSLAPGSIVVNISRGSVIDNQAMCRALNRGICYATDFPLPETRPQYWGDRYLETHHVGGYTYQGLEKTEALVAAELLKRIDQKAALVSN